MTAPPPLTGIRVLEFAGLAPGPYAGMLLADAGASVLRIDRASPGTSAPTEDMLARHKASITVDLKSEHGVALIKRLAAHADVIIDPFRPGVLEKLGLGPDVLCDLNKRLIYGRMTGFRRDGKYAFMAGHDINYLSVSGVLAMLGREGEKPHPPMNILADFAGGGAILFQGILMAVISRQSSGRGQVVEANMVDGSSHLTTFPRMGLKTPVGNRDRGTNLLDGGAPFYDTYETSDAKYMAVGALEPQFFSALLQGLGFAKQGWEENQQDRTRWPELRKLMTETFRRKTRSEWEAIFDGTDACCTPVLEYIELETDSDREGDQRPAVTLRKTPCLAVKESVGSVDPVRFGQGPGVPGDGYKANLLRPGAGGEEVLRQWMGWENGNEYALYQGGFVLKEMSKL
ncbi:CoA-transferase family III domain-containing protein [Fusarium flagelliforme]|uniref:Alpha-methylacyl-coa racemase n=1 Tax=Fusarium flagelliforme TaxID=2675880 RepID=A0A395MJU2_9HYPO|nr:CoA-transferase family III domain-containing protein [Fusarium flagelliforme]KAH7188567.1 CoA-transferase family III domain-containing protein [Fusarium flagelliforme]RFN47573.1 alpha-methylacyl-coa racemase [Fusarium flagelliforme]